MFAIIDKILFISLIALANFALGFMAAVCLGFRPRRWDTALQILVGTFLEPRAVGPPPAGERAQCATDAHDSPADTDDALSGAESPSANESAIDESAIDESAIDEPAAEEPAAVLSPDPVAVISEVSQKISAEFGKVEGTLEKADAELAASEQTVRALEDTAAEVEGAVQGLLQRFNAAMDQLRQVEAGRAADDEQSDAVLKRIDAMWTRFNDLAVQLVMLSYDEETLSDSYEQLATTCDQMRQACQQSCESLTSPLAESSVPT